MQIKVYDYIHMGMQRIYTLCNGALDCEVFTIPG